MQAALTLLNRQTWPLLAIGFAALILGSAHAIEHGLRYLPCELCLRQRDVYWAVVAMGVTGLVLARLKPTPRFTMALNILIGLVFITGAVVAAYHAGVEWKFWPGPEGCSSATSSGIVGMQLDDLGKRYSTVSCEDAPFHVLGLSMAGWNALVSAGLAGLSFYSAKRV